MSDLTKSQEELVCEVIALAVKKDSSEVVISKRKHASLKRVSKKGFIEVKEESDNGYKCRLTDKCVKMVSGNVGLLFEVSTLVGSRKLNKLSDLLGIRVPKMMLAAA